MADLESRVRLALAGRYEVLGRLGIGASAEVFRAHDTKLDRDVALKVLKPRVALVLGPDRFLREIRLAASLQHPHILPVYDSGETDGLLYFVTPVVSDTSLRGHIREHGPLPLDETLRIALEVGSALDYAHSHGVVHRDIKPANILLTDGGALVADFGIALPISEGDDTRLTASGLVVGTPAYMSPEQALGADVGPPTDIYALGCVTYEMLSARLPFEASNPAVMTVLHATESVPPLRLTRKDIPARVDRAVLRAMSKDPEKRFTSGSDFAKALTASRGPGEKIVDLVRASRARRVPRALALYAAIGLVALLATDWAVNRFLLSHHLTRFMATSLLLLVPAAGITWYFRARLRRAAAPLGLNLSFATVVLVLLFAGKDLGLTVTKRLVVNEAGAVETRLVPKPGFRHRIALFPFEWEGAPTAGAEVAWMGTGIPLVLQYKLFQDPFFEVRAGFRSALRRAGLADTAHAPPLLQNRVARQNGLDFVLTGSYRVHGEAIQASFELREVQRNRVVEAFALEASSLTTLADSAAEHLRDILPVPSGFREQMRNLATADLLTYSPEALRVWVEATERVEIDGNYGAAIPLLNEAVALDSGFAVASAHLFGAYVGSNDMDRAREAAENALRHEYRLTEVHALNFKQGYWIVVRGDWERAALLAERQVGITPYDVGLRWRFADIRLRYGDTTAAVAHYDTALSQDPRFRSAVDALAGLRVRQGNADEALALYEDYLQLVPGDWDARLRIGHVLLAAGELDRAEETFESIRLELPRDPRPVVALATVAVRRGEPGRAAELLDHALEVSHLAEDSAEVRLAQVDLGITRGRLALALVRLREALEASEISSLPVEQRSATLRAAATLAAAGASGESGGVLDSLAAELHPPLLVHRDAALTLYFSAAGPLDSLEASLGRFDEEADAIGRFEWQSLLDFGRAELDRHRGDCVTAIPHYESSLRARPSDPGPVYRGYADCLATAGRSADGAAALEAALEWSASDGLAHLALARILKDAGEAEPARRHLDAALRIWEAADPAYLPAAEAAAALNSLGDGAS